MLIPVTFPKTTLWETSLQVSHLKLSMRYFILITLTTTMTGTRLGCPYQSSKLTKSNLIVFKIDADAIKLKITIIILDTQKIVLL